MSILLPHAAADLLASAIAVARDAVRAWHWAGTLISDAAGRGMLLASSDSPSVIAFSILLSLATLPFVRRGEQVHAVRPSTSRASLRAHSK